MSDKILKMMSGPQPNNHNARREIETCINVLTAVRGRIVTSGPKVIDELEQVAESVVKVIRGLSASHDFGLPKSEPAPRAKPDPKPAPVEAPEPAAPEGETEAEDAPADAPTATRRRRKKAEASE